MSFLIKQISRTADGREIVRPTRIEKSTLTIGRASESDIHLQDLAVTPTHAIVETSDGRRISVKSAGTLGFGVDGRSVKNVDIDATKGAELRFGSHRLKVGLEDGDIVFWVERVEALSDASGDKDEQKVFSLRGALPGKRASAWGFVALVLVAFLAFPIWSYATSRGEKIRPASFHADSTWTSGSISESHKRFENDCQVCHVDAFVAVRDDACITCHAASHDGGKATVRPASMAEGAPDSDRAGPSAYDHAPVKLMAASKADPTFGGRVKGWFQAAFNVPQGRCVECHTEHEGAGPMAATTQQFCSDCHTGLEGRLKSAGIKTTTIGDARDFAEKHPEFRPAILAGYSGFSGNRPVRFDQRDSRLGGNPMLGWNFKRVAILPGKPVQQVTGLKFTHDQHLSTGRYNGNNVAQMWRTQGNGGPMQCADCHTTDASGTRYLPVDMEQSCQSCHSLGLQTVGGIIRQLPHGQPYQVIADIRAFYSSGGSFAQSGPPGAQYMGPVSRRRPGDVNTGRRADDAQRGRMAMAGASDNLIRTTFGPRGVCGECHQVSFDGPRGVTIAPVAQPMRYLRNGWFDHAPHVGLSVRDKAGARTWGCKDCHAAESSHDANDLLMPALATCQACHVGEGGVKSTAAASRLVVSRGQATKSSCAMCHDYHADFGAPWTLKRRDSKAKGRVIAALDSGRR